MRKVYVSLHGTYGDAEEMLVFGCEGWTDDDWRCLDWATDSERLAVASLINAYHKQHEELGVRVLTIGGAK